jgi:aspartate aminotransferase/aminotransferase
MKRFSRLAESLPRSGIREVMEFASSLEGVIHLEVGEPSFNTPDHIIEAALAAARDGSTKYTPNAGIPAVRRAVAEHYSRRWDRAVQPDDILLTAGAVNAIMSMIAALVDDGDEVLIPDPGWPNYVGIARLNRATPVRYPLRPERGYLPDPAELDALITLRTKVLILNNPGNPTGAVFPVETIEALVRLAADRNIVVISDEVYESIIFDGEFVPASRFDAGHVITVSGCSKSYAMTGWRLGWAITRPALVTLAGKVMESQVSCASSVSQRAAEAAVTGPQTCVEEMRAAYHRRRDLVRAELEPARLLPNVPSGAFYAMVDLRALGRPSQEITRLLLEEERVATAPGSTFGEVAEGFIRISLATADNDLLQGCRRIRRFAARHTPASAFAGVSRA